MRSDKRHQENKFMIRSRPVLPKSWFLNNIKYAQDWLNREAKQVINKSYQMTAIMEKRIVGRDRRNCQSGIFSRLRQVDRILQSLSIKASHRSPQRSDSNLVPVLSFRMNFRVFVLVFKHLNDIFSLFNCFISVFKFALISNLVLDCYWPI